MVLISNFHINTYKGTCTHIHVQAHACTPTTHTEKKKEEREIEKDTETDRQRERGETERESRQEDRHSIDFLTEGVARAKLSATKYLTHST